MKPDRIILFGSWASGQPDSDSNLDIMFVIQPFKKPSEIASAVSVAVSHEFSIDILAKTTGWVERTFAEGDPKIAIRDAQETIAISGKLS